MTPRSQLRVGASLLVVVFTLAGTTTAAAQPTLPPGARLQFGKLALRVGIK